jgi:hypothetical protein
MAVSVGPFARIVDLSFGDVFLEINVGSTGLTNPGRIDTNISASSGACSVSADGVPILSAGVGGTVMGPVPFDEQVSYVPPTANEDNFIFKIITSREASDPTPPLSTGAAYGAASGCAVEVNLNRLAAASPSGIITFTATAGSGSAANDDEFPSTSTGANASMTLKRDGAIIESFNSSGANGTTLTCQFNKLTGELTQA